MADVQRVVLVDSPQIAERGETLFPGALTLYANGKIPREALGVNDVVVPSVSRERIEALCSQLIAAGCPLVRQWDVDLSAFFTRQQVLDAAGAIKPYLPSSAPSELAAQVPPDPAGVPTPSGAEPDLSDSIPPWHDNVPTDAETSVKPHKRRRKPRLASVDGNLALDPDLNSEPMPMPLSEDSLAENFVRDHGQNWRFCTEWNLWLQWCGDGWHRDKRNEVSDICRRVTRDALELADQAKISDDGKRRLNSKRTVWNVRDVAGVDQRISILAEILDSDPMLLGVPGGVVDLKTGKFMDAEPEQYITRRCSVAPYEGPHPLFDRVLERACAGHADMREYLLRWFGYMLTGDVREEAFMFLHGPGGSGKSTLIKALTEIMGDYALTISMDALTESKNERHSQEIAKLEGARLVYASETEEGRKFKESLIKLLTGGDKIVAHRMRMDDREFKPTFKMLIYGNSVPHLKSVGEEMRRRIHLVEYAGSLAASERDMTLKQRLIKEYPAILHTLVRGCVDWQDCGGLGKPESVTDSVDKYLEGEDSLATFLEECVERDIQAREPSSAVYRRYRNWASAAGEYVMPQKRLIKQLRDRGFEQIRTKAARMISGLRLLAAPQEDQRPHWQTD